MTEAMPFLQKYDITFLRPPTIRAKPFSFIGILIAYEPFYASAASNACWST